MSSEAPAGGPFGAATSPDELRRLLARELHDRVAQTLTTMLIDLESFKLGQLGNQSALQEIAELQESTRDVLKNLRQVLIDLRGQTALEEDFAEEVRRLLARFKANTQLKVEFAVSSSWPSKIRSQAALDLYRIIEEALTNVRLHSGARSVEVVLGQAFDHQLSIEIKDDGRGTESVTGPRKPGMGLLGMRERALILGGRLELESDVGQGTTVRAILPHEQLI